MFSNSIAAVFFWFLLFRNISGLRVYLQNDLSLSLASISVISVVDFYLIAPFLSEIYFTISKIKDLNPFLQCRDWNEQMRSVVSSAVDNVHKHETTQADVAFHEGLQKSR